MPRLLSILAVLLVFSGILLSPLAAADEKEPIFSGPQPGERTTPFKVLELTGDGAGKERDPITENRGAPTAIAFLHGIERSLVPLLRVVDQYGALKKDLLRTEVVFLAADRLAGEERAKAASKSLKLASRVGLSLDGPEGPGNYGLNKDCLMTIVIAQEDKVTASFALVQPGIADAPRVLAALAAACGDPSPPSVESLSSRPVGPGQRSAGRPIMEGRRDEAGGARPEAGEPVDLSRFDLWSEAGLREAVRALIGEVERLRAEVAELRGERAGGAPVRRPRASGKAGEKSEKPAEDFPGAVPSDAKLSGLLRSAIRPTNDDAEVDRLIAEMEGYVKGNADLTRQAVDGWTRVLHFGDHYGTAHAREAGAALQKRLQER
jgi:hypothetical protein